MRAKNERMGGSPLRVTRRVATLSASLASSISYMVGSSDGGSCMSASIVATYSPCAASSPASNAASLPKLRENER